MIEYIVAENPDDRVLLSAVKCLNEGKLIAFPTDTNWVFAGSPLKQVAVDKLYKIKGSGKEKHFSLLCDSISSASQFADINDFAFKTIKRKLPGAYTFIFPPAYGIPKAIKNYRKEKQIGIRIPKSLLCQKLIEFNECPIIASSIHPESVESFDGTIYSYQIEQFFEHQLGMIIDPGEVEFAGESSVIDMSTEDGIPIVIRHGAGDVSSFLY